MAQQQPAVLIEIRENEAEILKIAERAQRALDSENNIVIPHAPAIATIAYVFLREAVKFMVDTKTPGEDAHLDLLQLIEIGITERNNDEAEKDGNLTPYVTPGKEMKLLVKSDDETEE